jgi:hypothetical protein
MDYEKSIQKAELEIIFGKKKGETIPLEKDIFSVGRDPGCDLLIDLPSIEEKELCIENRHGIFLLKSMTGREISVSGEKLIEKILETDDVITIGNLEMKFKKIYKEQSKYDREQAKQRIFSKVVDTTVVVLLVLIGIVLAGSSLFFYLERKFITDESEKLALSEKVEEKTVTESPAQEDIIDLLADAHRRMEIGNNYYRNRKLDESYLYRAILEWQVIIDLLKNIKPTPRICVETRKKIEKAQPELDALIKYLKNNAYAAYTLKADDQLKAILERMMRIKPVPTDKDYIWTKRKYMQLMLGKQAHDKSS